MFSLEKLFELVHNLTSSEKRLLRLHASIQSGTKNYMQLFELLEELEQYDPIKFQQLYEEKEYSFNLSGTQTYLADKILDMLCSAQEQEFIEARLNKLLLQSKIMEQRGFYDLSFDLLKKAKKLARKYHIHYVLLEILVREARIISNIETKKFEVKFQQIFDEVEYTLGKLKEENFYRSKSFWVFSFALRSRSTFKQTEKDLLKNIVESGNQPSSQNFYANLFFFKIKNNYYYLAQDPKNRLNWGTQLIHFLEQNKKMIQVEFNEYLIAICNTVIASVETKEFQIVPFLLKKLEELSPKSYFDKAHLFQNTLSIKLFYYLNIEDYKSAQDLAPKAEEKLIQYQHFIKQSRIINIYYNLTLAFFLDANYDQAHHWLEKILSVKRTDETRKDILRFARILHLILFYGMEQLGLLDNLIRSVSRNKLVKEAMQPFDRLIIKSFKKLVTFHPKSKEAKDLLLKLYEDIKALPKEQQHITGYEEIIMWLKKHAGINLNMLTN